jgi:8-oxo-dGTP pyrophosphatase MutT (NUDIX family)
MLHVADIRASLRAALDPRPDHRPSPGDRLAAVLVPLILGPDPEMLFTVRAETLSRHAGEISFPGGLQDAGETLEQTARREAFEEVGLDPTTTDVLGALSPLNAYASAILMVPFVGIVENLPALTLSEGEVQRVLMVPVLRLAEVESPVTYERDGGPTWHGWAYEVGGDTIWGATGWILHMFLEMLRKETSWTIP